MSSGTRLAAFAVSLLAVLGVAIGVGSRFETADTESDTGHGSGNGHSEVSQAPAGLAIADGSYSLRLATTQLRQGEGSELRFLISDMEGEAITGFDELHERRMHLIVVRRDGTRFNHLHPEMDEAGTWTAAVKLEEPGVYRAFADFSVDDEQHTLAGDVFVSGSDFEARSFPDPALTYSTNGYEVSLHSDEPLAGQATSLVFAVTKNGQELNDLDPYLGAKGHLVALREGDLAFLHVHPEGGEHGHGDSEAGHRDDPAANEIAFAATFPTSGHYRLYLQFKHDGVVKTAEFTVLVSR